MSMTVLPVAEARDQLSRLISEAETFQERFQISRNGRAAAVLLGQDDYESLLETIDIMSDTGLVAELKTAIADDHGDKGITGSQLAERITALRNRVDD